MKDKDLFAEIKSELFVQCYNDFTNYKNSDLWMSSDELYVYSAVNLLERGGTMATVNLYLLEKYLPVPFGRMGNHNRNRISEILMVLRDRNIIMLDRSIDKISPSDNFNVLINRDYIEEVSVKKGFEKIPYQAFTDCKNAVDYYIYCTVHRYGERGYLCSYQEWSNILKYSTRTAIRKINSAVENGVIFRKTGKHISKNEQEVNRYSTYSFKKEVEVVKDHEE